MLGSHLASQDGCSPERKRGDVLLGEEEMALLQNHFFFISSSDRGNLHFDNETKLFLGKACFVGALLCLGLFLLFLVCAGEHSCWRASVLTIHRYG